MENKTYTLIQINGTLTSDNQGITSSNQDIINSFMVDGFSNDFTNKLANKTTILGRTSTISYLNQTYEITVLGAGIITQELIYPEYHALIEKYGLLGNTLPVEICMRYLYI